MKAKRPRGRPRSTAVHRGILKAALTGLAKSGFRALTVETIAADAGVGKMAIYRRWPNKAAVVMDAFLTLVGPHTLFPPALRATERIRLQMHLQVKFFRGNFGKMIKALLGEAQFDPELAIAFRERWIQPRRQMTREVLEQAIHQDDLRPDLDPEAVIDLLYGPLYYRLQIETGPIDEAYADTIFNSVMERARKRTAP